MWSSLWESLKEYRHGGSWAVQQAYNSFVNYSSYGFHAMSRYTGYKPVLYTLFPAYAFCLGLTYGERDEENEDTIHTENAKLAIALASCLGAAYVFYRVESAYENGYDRRLDHVIWGIEFVLGRSYRERLPKMEEVPAYGLTWAGYLSGKSGLPKPHSIFPAIVVYRNEDTDYDRLPSSIPYRDLWGAQERVSHLCIPYIDAIDSSMREVLGPHEQDTWLASRLIYGYAFHTGLHADRDTLMFKLPSIRRIHWKEITDMMITNRIKSKLEIDDPTLIRKIYSYVCNLESGDLRSVEYQCGLLSEIYGSGHWMENRERLFSSRVDPVGPFAGPSFEGNRNAMVEWRSAMTRFWRDYVDLVEILRPSIEPEILSLLDWEVIMLKTFCERVQSHRMDLDRATVRISRLEDDVRISLREFTNESNIFLLTDLRDKFLYSKHVRMTLESSFVSYPSNNPLGDSFFCAFRSISRREEDLLKSSLNGFDRLVTFHDWWYSQINATRLEEAEDRLRWGENQVTLLNGSELIYANHLSLLNPLQGSALNVIRPTLKPHLSVIESCLEPNLDTYDVWSRLTEEYPSRSTPTETYLISVLSVLMIPQYRWVRFLLQNLDSTSVFSLIGRLPMDFVSLNEAYRVYSFCHDSAFSLLGPRRPDEADEGVTAAVRYWVKHTLFLHGSYPAMTAISSKNNLLNEDPNQVLLAERNEIVKFHRSWVIEGLCDHDEATDGARLFAKILLAVSLRRALAEDLNQLVTFARWAKIWINTRPIRDWWESYEPSSLLRRSDAQLEEWGSRYLDVKNTYNEPMYGQDHEIRTHLFCLLQGQNKVYSETPLLNYLTTKNLDGVTERTQANLSFCDRETKPSQTRRSEAEITDMILNSWSANNLGPGLNELRISPLRSWNANDISAAALDRWTTDIEQNHSEDIVYDADSDYTYHYE